MVQDTREEDTSLPQGWEKWRCHSSGLFYYYDRTTKCRQWGRPGRTTEQQLVDMTEQFTQRVMHQLNEMNNKMKEMNDDMRTQRGEIRAWGEETRTAGEITAAPRGDTIEPMGEGANCVGPAMEAGEDEIIREMCWGRLVKVTERATVTVTEREKLNGGDGDVHEAHRDEGDKERGDRNKEDDGNKNTRDAEDGNGRGETTR